LLANLAALTLSHGFAAPERRFSVNNALLTKERGSLEERSIVAIRVLKEAIRIFGSCLKVPITKALLQSVKQAHSEYALFLENERKQALLEEEERKRIEQAREPRKLSRLENQERAAQKAKNDLLEQLKAQEKLEESQLLEQDTARELISEASKKLTEALQQVQGNVQSVKEVAQVMLSAGNEKFNAAAKQLADIRLKKEKISKKLHQQKGKVQNAEGSAATTNQEKEASLIEHLLCCGYTS